MVYDFSSRTRSDRLCSGMQWNGLSSMVLGAVSGYDPDRVVGQLDNPLLQFPDLFVSACDFSRMFSPHLFDFPPVFLVLFFLGDFRIALRFQDFSLTLGLGFPDLPVCVAFGLRA